MKSPSWEDKLGPLFLVLEDTFLYATLPCLLNAQLSLPARLPDPRRQTGWAYVFMKHNPFGCMRSFLVITGPLPVQLVPVFSQSDSPGMESRVPNTVFPQNPTEPLNLPLLHTMRLAAGQSSIILYCNKIFECVYSYFLQSFHFVFNINGLSQIQ